MVTLRSGDVPRRVTDRPTFNSRGSMAGNETRPDLMEVTTLQRRQQPCSDGDSPAVTATWICRGGRRRTRDRRRNFTFLLIWVAILVVEVSTSKIGKHGHAKCHFVGIDVFNGKKFDDIVPFFPYNCDIPHVTHTDYQLIDISEDGFVYTGAELIEKNKQLYQKMMMLSPRGKHVVVESVETGINIEEGMSLDQSAATNVCSYNSTGPSQLEDDCSDTFLKLGSSFLSLQLQKEPCLIAAHPPNELDSVSLLNMGS